MILLFNHNVKSSWNATDQASTASDGHVEHIEIGALVDRGEHDEPSTDGQL